MITKLNGTQSEVDFYYRGEFIMTQKEEFLLLQSYEEFDEKREHFQGMKLDHDIREHMKRIFPPIELFEGDAIYPVNKNKTK